jgi:cell division septation protein DedD
MMSILTGGSMPEAPRLGQAADAPEDFEIVLGKRQVAGVLFLATVFVVVFAGLAYVAGEAMAPARTVMVETPAPVADAAPAPVATSPQLTTPPQVTTPLPVATLVATPPPIEAPKPAASQPPVFANPKDGVLYLQLGAVEKGIAVIFVDGLRAHGFEAFAAPGPTEKIFRVLVGPLADHEAYQRAKKAVDDLGLNTFARKYQQ